MSLSDDEFPDCPECESNVFVGGDCSTTTESYLCHLCGWRSADEQDDTEGDRAGVVPEDFDPQEAKNAWSTTPLAERKRCPDCHSADVISVSHSQMGPVPTHEYRCGQCCHKFDEPVTGVVP